MLPPGRREEQALAPDTPRALPCRFRRQPAGRAGDPVRDGGRHDLLTLLIIVLGLIVMLLGSSVRVVTQFERGVVLRFGRLSEASGAPA